MKIIRTNIGMPPSGIQYVDPRTPSASWTDDHTWLADRVAQVIKFRSANPGIYPEPQWTDYAFVSNQIVEFNCPRYPAGYCLEVGPPAAPAPLSPVSQQYRVCPKCGVDLTPVLCSSCGGRLITGYKCPTCGQEYPK